MNLKKSLTENFGVKLVALVVALFIWFNASGQKETVWMTTVPISLENASDSLVITGGVPEQAEISIGGTKRQLILAGFKRMKLVVDLTDAIPGRQRVSLTPRQIRLPASIDRRNVRILEPVSLDLRIERLVTRRVQVTLSSTGTIDENLLLVDGAFSITPSWVAVTGPESSMENIRTVATESFNLGAVRKKIDRELQLSVDDDRLKCVPDHVTISINVSRRGERVLANVPPTVLVDSEDYSVVVVPSAVTLTLSGPQAVLDTLSSGDVSVLLNLSGRGEASYRVAPELILPPGVELASINVDSLTVRIRKNSTGGSP